jgi:hypothetical protein
MADYSSDISSNNSLNVFTEDKYHYPDWFSKKKYVFYKKMLLRLKKLRYVHNRSSEYYSSLHMKYTWPSIIITSLSGIASFLSTSDFVDDQSRTGFGVSVGVLASISTLMQTISGSCKFDTKSDAHRTVADEYDSLITKLKFEMEMPNEEDFTDKMEQEILTISNKCNYFPPQFIMDEWRKNNSKDELQEVVVNNNSNSNSNINSTQI